MPNRDEKASPLKVVLPRDPQRIGERAGKAWEETEVSVKPSQWTTSQPQETKKRMKVKMKTSRRGTCVKSGRM